jgi:hypothetical protein
LPLLSHLASLSQTPDGAALAVPAMASGAPMAIAPATASRRRFLDVDVREREAILSVFSSMGGECLTGIVGALGEPTANDRTCRSAPLVKHDEPVRQIT